MSPNAPSTGPGSNPLDVKKTWTPAVSESPSWQIESIGGLDEGRVVRFILLAFLAKPTQRALLSVAISGDDKLISDKLLTPVSVK